MSYYPSLYEAELTQNQFEINLGKILGAKPTGNIIVDPNTRKIKMLNGKKAGDAISNWSDIQIIKGKGDDVIKPDQKMLVDFIQSRNPELDVMKILGDIKQNHLKPGGKTKYQPVNIPSFPEGMTYYDYWVYGLKQNPEETKKALSYIEKDDTLDGSQKSENTKSKYEIPANLTQWFVSNKKEKEWKSFLKNASSGKGMSVVGEMNYLFELLSDVVDGNISGHSRYKVKKGYLPTTLRDESDAEVWKKEMIEYIGKYTTSTVEQVNTDGAYKKMVGPKNAPLGFLGVLMVSEPSGMGRGEILMAFVMQGAQFAGGSESYDLKADVQEAKGKADLVFGSGKNTITYELKDYSETSKANIRLGAHGGLMRFQWWKEIEKTIRLARSIENELGKDEIEKILNSEEFFSIWKKMTSNKPYQNTREIGTAADAGEVNTSKIETIKLFFGLIHELLNKDKKNLKKDNYTYAILKGRNLKPQIVQIAAIPKDDVLNIQNLEIVSDNADMAKFKEFEDIKYVKNPLGLQEDLDKIGEHYKESSDVDYFMVFLKEKLEIDTLENYGFQTISQKAVKISNKNDDKDDEGVEGADEAFTKWKKQDDKDLYSIFSTVYTNKRRGIDESFYPTFY